MRLLFLSDNFPPEVNAPASRTFEHCIEWQDSGQEVEVITCAPNFPRGKVFVGYENRLLQSEYLENGVKVTRVWSYIAPNKGFFRRTIDYLSYALMAFIIGLFKRFDIVVGTSPHFFTALSACVLAFIRGRPWVMEVRDLWPDSIAAVGIMSDSSRAFRFLKWLEIRLYSSANLIIVVTESFRRILISQGVEADKIVVVPNGVRRGRFNPMIRDGSLKTSLKLADKFVIGYIGTHGMAHGLDFVLRTAKELTDDSIHFLLVGDGAEKQNLVTLSKQLDLTNVTFVASVGKDDVARYISVIDVALVNLRKSSLFETVLPSKIFENASMQKPILLGVQGEAAELVAKYGAGIAFMPEDAESLLNALKKVRIPTVYEDLTRGCARLADDYDRKILALNMLHEIQGVL